MCRSFTLISSNEVGNIKDGARAAAAPPAAASGSAEINGNGDESVVLIHPVGDLPLALVIRLGFSVRMEAISAVPSTRGSGSTTWSRHIASGCLRPNTFHRIRVEIMIKGAGGLYRKFSRGCGLGAPCPDMPASRARLSRGSGVCRGDAIIVRRGSEGPDHARHRQGRPEKRFARFSKLGKRFAFGFVCFFGFFLVF